MAPNRLKQNITYIDILAKAKPKQRSAILQNAEKDLIICLCECALNILNGNVPLNSKQFSRLKTHHIKLRRLTAPKTKFTDKKKILVQKGGFIPALLAPILGIAGQLLVEAITRKK